MKHSLIPSILLLCSGLHAAGGSSVAVMPLVPQGVDSTSSMIVTDALIDELMKTSSVRVLERSQMESILKEQGFQQSGACDGSECAVQIGKLLSIDRIVVGSLGRLGNSYTLSTRIVNVETGEITASSRQQQKGEIDAVTTGLVPTVARELSKGFGSKASTPAPVAKKTESVSNASASSRPWRILLEGSAGLAMPSSEWETEPRDAVDEWGFAFQVRSGLVWTVNPSLELTGSVGYSIEEFSQILQIEGILANRSVEFVTDYHTNSLDIAAEAAWFPVRWFGLHAGGGYSVALGGTGLVTGEMATAMGGAKSFERSFDLGGTNPEDGTADPDQASRPFLLAGAEWRMGKSFAVLAQWQHSLSSQIQADHFDVTTHRMLVGARYLF